MFLSVGGANSCIISESCEYPAGGGIEVVVVGVIVSSPAGPCSVVWCLVSMSACAIISGTGSVNPWMSVATNTLP